MKAVSLAIARGRIAHPIRRLRRRPAANVETAIRVLLSQLSVQPAISGDLVAGRVAGGDGLAIVPLSSGTGTARFVAKLTASPEGVGALERSRTALDALASDPRLDAWRSIVPRPVAWGTAAGFGYLVETALPGRPRTPTSDRHRLSLLPPAADAIAALHRGTVRSLDVDEQRVRLWIDARCDALGATLPSGAQTRLEGLRQRLRSHWLQRTVDVSWVHGDYWLGNVLLDEDGGAVTGIVDWESARPEEPPFHDVLHLILYSRSRLERVDLGRVIARAIVSGIDPLDEAIVEARSRDWSSTDLPPVLATYWLAQMANNIRRHPALGSDRRWLHENVIRVLDAL